MVVDVIEEVEAESAHILLAHHCLIQDPGENIADDGAVKEKNYMLKKTATKICLPGVVNRPLDRHELVHLALVDLRPVPPGDGHPTYEAHFPLHRDTVRDKLRDRGAGS